MAVVTVADFAPQSEAADVALPPFEWADFTLEFVPSFSALEAEWRALDEAGAASMFQSRLFLRGWLDLCAGAAGEEPLFVLGRKGNRTAFILPFAVTRRSGFKVLTWLGQSHANYGMGLFDKDALAEAHAWDFEELVGEIGRRAGVSVIHLDKQPERWAGFANPFASGRRALKTANDTFYLHMEEDFDAQYRRLFSGRTRSGLNRKQRRLEELGGSFNTPEAGARRALVTWFFEQKSAQLARGGQASPFDVPSIRALYYSLADRSSELLLDEVAVNGQCIAVDISLRQGRTTYLINAVHDGGEHAKQSPGALLLHRMIARAHAAGTRMYDFGPGELPYKLEWAPEVVALRASTYLINPLAVPLYAALVLGGIAKAKIKRSARLHDLVRRLRALRSPSAAAPAQASSEAA